MNTNRTVEMTHGDGTRSLMLSDNTIAGNVIVRVAGMEIKGPWWRRLRVALAVLFHPMTLRNVHISICNNVLGSGVSGNGAVEVLDVPSTYCEGCLREHARGHCLPADI